MTALLDTHTLVWYAFRDPKLSATAEAVISKGSNRILISPASYWEIAIKVALGKWQLRQPYDDLIDELWTVHMFTPLPILPAHTSRLLTLPAPANHRDPFDRLLVAQGLAEGVPIISADPKFDQYGVTRIW